MAARAIWKAQLKVGSTRIPVKLFSAVVDRTVRFHILEEKTKARVKQHMVNPASGKEVSSQKIQKGYEIEPGTFVILTDEELEKIEPPPSRDIEISHFISPEHITSQLYDHPYYLGPDGDEKSYFAFAEALTNRNREGIARWVMRDRQYSGALRAEEGNLILITLRNPDEVVLAEDLPAPGRREVDKKELSIARQLVAMLDSEFDPSAFRDEYRERVEEFIESKAKGKALKLPTIKSKRAPASLSSALLKSVEKLKKEKAAA